MGTGDAGTVVVVGREGGAVCVWVVGLGRLDSRVH